jgi:quinol monooxygenase YgiN
MTKLAIVATIKIAPGRRAEYQKHLEAHAKRCRDTEPGTLQFEILVPHDQPDTLMLYEVYTSTEAFEAHWNGPSLQQARNDTAGLVLSLTGIRCTLVE